MLYIHKYPEYGTIVTLYTRTAENGEFVLIYKPTHEHPLKFKDTHMPPPTLPTFFMKSNTILRVYGRIAENIEFMSVSTTGINTIINTTVT